MAKFDSVDDYLASLDPPKGDTLRSVIEVILGEYPELECKLAWNVPQIHRGRDGVFGLSALKNHLALAPWSPDVMVEFGPRLQAAGYVVKKNLFHIPVDWDVDRDLVCDLVRARLAELDAN
jgi:uncharacterized protein YdhG (YjbR/CyaY superfamily)